MSTFPGHKPYMPNYLHQEINFDICHFPDGIWPNSKSHITSVGQNNTNLKGNIKLFSIVYGDYSFTEFLFHYKYKLTIIFTM
jgi:hypothetical protein